MKTNLKIWKKNQTEKIQYKNGVSINYYNKKTNNLNNEINSNNEKYHNNNYEEDFLGNKNRCKSNDNFPKLKSMIYEDVFGINKKK